MNLFPEGPFRRTDIEGEADSYAHKVAREYEARFPFADAGAVEAIIAMGSAYLAFQSAFSQKLDSLGMGKLLNRYSALRILYFAEDKRMLAGRLGRELNVTSANMTYLIDGLESDRLVRRVASESDRRSTFIELTPEGEALCTEVIPDIVLFLNSICDTLNDDEKAMLSSLLARLQRHIETSFPSD